MDVFEPQYFSIILCCSVFGVDIGIVSWARRALSMVSRNAFVSGLKLSLTLSHRALRFASANSSRVIVVLAFADLVRVERGLHILAGKRHGRTGDNRP